MATEPTQMITGDVMELHHLIYAERAAHAAEVARYRSALEETTGACQLVCNWHHNITVEGALAVGKAALSTPPTAAVQAVEGMQKALKAQPCRCHVVVLPQEMSANALESGACAEEKRCARCVALAAWKEATRG